MHAIADYAVNMPNIQILLELNSAFSLVVFTDLKGKMNGTYNSNSLSFKVKILRNFND